MISFGNSASRCTVSQLINPLEQMFGFLPEKKQVAVMKAIGSDGLENIHRPQNAQNTPHAVEIQEP